MGGGGEVMQPAATIAAAHMSRNAIHFGDITNSWMRDFIKRALRGKFMRGIGTPNPHLR
jgi:hypothetical protein